MAKKQDSFYFNNFIDCATHACSASKLLCEIMTGFDKNKLEEYLNAMHMEEHSADIKKHELLDVLVKAFITPIDREDIISVSQNLDEMTDKIEDVLIRIYCNNITSIRPDALELAQVVAKCCDEVLALLGDFENFRRSKSLREHIIKLNSLEEEADKLYIACMRNLHVTSTDVMEVIAWRDVYTYLEKCADTAEHIGDIVESVIMKNS